MTELLRNAWMGWHQFIEAGKLMVFLPVSLLFLWLTGKWRQQRNHCTLFCYTAVMMLCCILPVTAVVLMVYQTRFYDYQWVWSLVPMTAATAWAGTEFLDQCWKGFRYTQWRKGLPVSALLLAALVLCSGFGNGEFDRNDERQRRLQAKFALESVMQQLAGRQGEVLLWAPREILEYTREFDGSLRLIYGRNMWDASLGAYSYDIYSQELQNLYLWMENVDETGIAVVDDPVRGEVVLQGENCVAAAVNAGANCILLPSRLESGKAETLARIMGGNAVLQGDYYLLTR